MFNWFSKQSDSVKIMIVIGVVSIVGIIFRWDTIRDTLSDDFRNRFGGSDTTTVERPRTGADTIQERAADR